MWIYFPMIFVIEYSRSIFPCCYKKKSAILTNIQDEDINEEDIKDQDVIAEESYVKSSNELAIKVQNLRKVYSITTNSGYCKSGKNVSYKVAVKDISFGVQKGECFCLLGTNGAGKTSAFKILSGELLPTRGEAFIKGHDVVTQLPKVRS